MNTVTVKKSDSDIDAFLSWIQGAGVATMQDAHAAAGGDQDADEQSGAHDHGHGHGGGGCCGGCPGCGCDGTCGDEKEEGGVV